MKHRVFFRGHPFQHGKGGKWLGNIVVEATCRSQAHFQDNRWSSLASLSPDETTPIYVGSDRCCFFFHRAFLLSSVELLRVYLKTVPKNIGLLDNVPPLTVNFGMKLLISL